jgi:alkylated DNA repair dioxygenase AlkB
VRYGEGDNVAAYVGAGGVGGAGSAVYGETPLHPSRPLPAFLLPLRRRVAAWRGVPAADYVHALVTEYPPGAPIGWHSDAPHFEEVVGISLAGSARMRFRPYADPANRKAAIALDLAPRSAYVMQGDIRRHWQHHIPPLAHRRYSITFRTLCMAGNAASKADIPARSQVRPGSLPAR